jgi:hypothetical protein
VCVLKLPLLDGNNGAYELCVDWLRPHENLPQYSLAVVGIRCGASVSTQRRCVCVCGRGGHGCMPHSVVL